MKSKDKITVIFILLLSFCFLVYFLWGFARSASIYFFSEDSMATIIETRQISNKTDIVYRYENKADDCEYTVVKSVGRKIYERLKNKKRIKIKYSTIFPDYTVIDGTIHYSPVLIFFGCIITGIGVYRSVLALRRKIQPSALG